MTTIRPDVGATADKARILSQLAAGRVRRARAVARSASNRARDAVLGPSWATARYWERRHRDSPGMFDAQWGTRDVPLRQILAERVAAFSPASVLEAGCGVGTNLHHIHAPKVAGVDVSAAAIEYARGKLPTCELEAAGADKLPFHDNSFDVVFTCGLLVCIGPDLVTRALQELARVSRGVVLLAEAGPPERREDWNHGETTYWRRDYAQRLRDLNISASSEQIPGEARIGHIDTLITARLS
jgi:SAM-dependent methyltransferase